MIEMQEVPLVQRQIACAAHAAPFQLDFPRGWDVWAPQVAQEALNSPMLQTGVDNPRFWDYDALFWEIDDRDVWPDVVVLPATRLSASRVGMKLFERPACEWVHPAKLLGLYRASGIGAAGVCNVCRQVGEGAPYPIASGRNFAVVDHVCWRCVVRKQVMRG